MQVTYLITGESRYCYHGVPHILSQVEETLLFPSEHVDQFVDAVSTSDDIHMKNVKLYLSTGRINVNIRQVVPDNGIWIEKCGSGAMQNKTSTET
jgi:hypothetical protein